MKKFGIIAALGLLMILPGGALDCPEVTEAIELAYNFQFDDAETVLEEYQRRNPEDLKGDLGRIVFDFLLIKQNPLKQNFQRIYEHLERAEEKVKTLLEEREEETLRFYLCFINYYYMKSYALEARWIRTLSHALEARKLAVALEDRLALLPDLYFILGDQDYSTSLAPEYLKPLLRTLNFTPDRYGGFSYIRQATQKGDFTRYEASLMYISSCIYVEKDYRSALDSSERFLQEFPGNLSVRFFLIDLLLRRGEVEEAESLMEGLGRQVESGAIGGKWIPRYIQMRGNLRNARGDYPGAIEFYRQALSYPEISGYTATEIALETGKLHDILGNRKEAMAAYKECAKGGGLELQKDEARTLRREPYTESRGSY